MTIESTLERSKEEIGAGRLWRAKEILASSLATYGYSREIYLAYADVLYALGDKLDSGKYYLLSVEEPSESQQQSIQLFLDRFENDDWRQLISRFPNAVKSVELQFLPKNLATHLLALGAPATMDAHHTNSPKVSVWTQYFLPIGCLSAVAVVGICTIVGAYTIFGWVIGRQ